MSDDPGRARAALVRLMSEPEAPVSDSSRSRIEDVHLADSLTGLEFEELSGAREAADIGSGAGLPGLPLALNLPDTNWTPAEATGRKAQFIERAASEMGLGNVSVRASRTEELGADPATREKFDVVTARAVGPLSTTAELASPLLRPGGHLLIWRGARDLDAEAEFDAISEDRLGIVSVEVRPVTPYPASRDRHIHLLRKNGPTPEGLPRRPGVAAKRPFGTE